MTKRKPDKVIEYRISLQDKERELLEHLVYVEEGLLEMERAETRSQRALRRAQVMPPRRSR